MRAILWTGIGVALIMGLLFGGCAPQSVKTALNVALKSNAKIQEIATAPIGETEDVAARLPVIEATSKDTGKLLDPVETYIGKPIADVPYAPEAVAGLAEKARRDAELRVLVRETILKAIPKPIKSGLSFLEGILAVVLGYGGMKGANKGIGGLINRLFGKKEK